MLQPSAMREHCTAAPWSCQSLLLQAGLGTVRASFVCWCDGCAAALRQRRGNRGTTCPCRGASLARDIVETSYNISERTGGLDLLLACWRLQQRVGPAFDSPYAPRHQRQLGRVRFVRRLYHNPSNGCRERHGLPPPGSCKF